MSAVVGYGWASIPQPWPLVRAKRVLREVDHPSTSGTEQLYLLSRERGLLPRTDESGVAQAASYVGYKTFQRGDIVLNKMQAWNGAFALAPGKGLISPDYAVFRPTDPNLVDARFLVSLFRTPMYIGLFTGLSRGMGTGFNRLHPEQLLDAPLSLPPVDEQRRISNFLDADKAAIERLLHLEDQLTALALERMAARRESLLTGVSTRPVPLQHLTDPRRPIVYGIVQAGEEVPDGVPYIKTGDLARLDPATLSRTSHEIDRAYRRARVRPGDLVMAMRASIGLAVKVPEALRVANLTQGTARIAPRQGVDTEWLFHVLRTIRVQDQCQARAVGSTYRTLNIWDLRRIDIPTPPLADMPALGTQVAMLSQDTDRQIRLLSRKKELLLERRQALITAAVTGQFDVTTGRGAA